MIAPYDLLAAYYDGGWFQYSEYIAALIEEIEEERTRPFTRICDAACGTGLLLRLLGGEQDEPVNARRLLAGFDLSPAMLVRARERVPEAHLAPGDLRGPFPFNGPFDLITCVYDSLNYLLETAEVTAFFRAALGRLFSDGMLLVDFNNHEMYENRDGTEQPHLIGGETFRESISLDPGPPPLVTTVFEFESGREIHKQRAYEVEEIEQLLKEAGFRVVDTFDVMDADEGFNAVDEDTRAASGKIVCTAIPG